MKKLSLIVLFAILAFVPSSVYAAFDITLTDKSTDTAKSGTITVDSGTDKLESIAFSIESSEDITFNDITTGDITCDTFNKSINNTVVNISCEFTEAKSIKGVLANISFETDESKYTISVLKDTVQIGEDVEVGNIVNISKGSSVTTTAQTQTATTTTATKQEVMILGINIMDYLPYILLGGSVILLISIIGVLLSKKGDDKENSVTEPKVETEVTTEPVKEPTLMEKVTMAEPPVIQPVEQAEVAQESVTASEEQDLQALMEKENIPQVNSQPITMPETPAQQDIPVNSPAVETQPITEPIQEIPTEQNTEITPETDLQQLINSQIEQIPQTPVETTPLPAEQPKDEDTLPPVPPQM